MLEILSKETSKPPTDSSISQTLLCWIFAIFFMWKANQTSSLMIFALYRRCGERKQEKHIDIEEGALDCV